jgi:putative ABC transport system permease protein
MAAVWYRFRAESRIRWRAWLGLALLIGLAGGASLALWAGARRTETAYGRFLDSQHAYDVAIFLPFPADQPDVAKLDPAEIAALPEVRDIAVASFFYIGDDHAALVDPDGRFGDEINRFKILEGRAANPGRPDEAVIGLELAGSGGLRVGDRIPLLDPDAVAAAEADVENPVSAAFLAFAKGALEAVPDGMVTVVGIEASPGEFLASQGSGLGGLIHLTPAFAAAVSGPETDLISARVVFVRLERGDADVAAFQDGFSELADGLPVMAGVQSDNAANVERSFHTQAVALGLLAGLTALTALVILSQILARSAWLESVEFPTLGALGFTRSQRFGLGALRLLAVNGGAAVLALGIALAASSLFPRGLVRTAEPDPGFAVDAPVLTAGAVAILIAVAALGAIPAARAAGTAARSRGDAGSPRRSVVAGALSGAGVPPAAVAGVRMALEPGRGRTAVPVRSALACLSLAVATIVAALGFGASLTHLLDTPPNYGVGWDLQFIIYFGEDGQFDPFAVVDDAATAFATMDGVEGVSTGYTAIAFEVGGRRADAVVFEAVEGSGLVPVLEGRLPNAPDEIMLASRTLEDLGIDIGSRVEAGSQGSEPRSMLVVGRGVIPPSTDSSRLGEGSVITLAAARDLIPGIERANAPSVYVTLDGSGDGPAIADRVAAELEISDNSETVTTFPPPSEIVDFGRVESMPGVLGAVLGVLAVGALAHVLLSAVRRRRRDLAMLRTFGFVRRQIGSTVAWQATALVVVALAIGVPLGISLGRWVWTRFASDLGVIVDVRVPVPTLLLVVGGALVIANLVAAVPAWLAARTRPAIALRSE